MSEWTVEQVRELVRVAEDDLLNIWPQQPSPAVIARTVVYGLLDRVRPTAETREHGG